MFTERALRHGDLQSFTMIFIRALPAQGFTATENGARSTIDADLTAHVVLRVFKVEPLQKAVGSYCGREPKRGMRCCSVGIFVGGKGRHIPAARGACARCNMLGSLKRDKPR